MKDWKLISTEELFEDAGSCRTDLVVYDEEGILSIADYKCVSTLGRKQPTKWFQKHFVGNQAHAYKAAYEEKHKVKVERFYIVQLLLDKDEVHVKGAAYNEERHNDWLNSSFTSYNRMAVEDAAFKDMGNMIAEESSNHENEWGTCEFYDSCVLQGRDLSLLKQQFVQVERKS